MTIVFDAVFINHLERDDGQLCLLRVEISYKMMVPCVESCIMGYAHIVSVFFSDR